MAQFVKLTMLSSLGLGTTLTFLSSHWLLAWMGLEISTLAILPLMAQHHHPRASEATTKYLLIQACATGMLLFATTLNAWTDMMWNIVEMKDSMAIALATLALALKLGLAPFHFWLPEVMQGLDLTTGLILATWQKLAPFALLFQISHATLPSLLTAIGLTSAALAAWGGLNQTQLRKILAYSSTAHLGWMIIIIQYSPNLAMLSLGIYIFMTMAAFLILKETSSTKISVLSLSWSKGPMMAATLILILLSLAGLPPLTGFMIKWYILEEMTKQGMFLPATLIVMSALISLYFYIRLGYFTTITLFPNTTKIKTLWRRKNKQDKITLATVTTVALIFLPMAPLIMALANSYA
uniref:NADH-ubiquinone oxidoreductase chain 2 n=3 Tax=Oligosarcus argenteus TaxID=1604128 RepID=A0A5A4MKQ5_9TELE|nr:NADH dehydrogenase subunit 2 [Oligosarcus argenteus]AXY96048.1 NADH dehydrogenase subunit 2 [Oligosarcus argenteus]